jgi:uncharacterized membrane protein
MGCVIDTVLSVFGNSHTQHLYYKVTCPKPDFILKVVQNKEDIYTTFKCSCEIILTSVSAWRVSTFNMLFLLHALLSTN